MNGEALVSRVHEARSYFHALERAFEVSPAEWDTRRLDAGISAAENILDALRRARGSIPA